ncbi:hypothetical protein ACFLXU_03355 [Chloroflexota bacterium]
MSEKGSKYYWSDDEQIYFVDGKGYGLTPELKSICLGDEQDILNTLNGGKIKEDLTPLQRQVLVSIMEYRKELNSGKSEANIRKPSSIRSKSARTLKRRAASPRQSASRKRVPLHSAKR